MLNGEVTTYLLIEGFTRTTDGQKWPFISRLKYADGVPNDLQLSEVHSRVRGRAKMSQLRACVSSPGTSFTSFIVMLLLYMVG